jgi:carbonic anhydrase
MEKLIPITKVEDIFPEYRNTPVGLLLEYHNLNRAFETYTGARLLIATCMDNRISLQLPDKYAYIIRTGGGNILHNDFHISYAVAVGQIKYIVLIGHNKCGMVNLEERKDSFVSGLVERAGWTKEIAENHFDQDVSQCEIENEIEYLLKDVERLREQYPKIEVVPLMYLVEDNLLYQIKEE